MGAAFVHQCMDAKAILRHNLRAQRAALAGAEIRQKSAAIAARVCALSTFAASRTIMVYLALPQEVQTAEIIRAAQHQHTRVVVPVVNGTTLLAVELPRETAQLRRGPYGILEPSSRTACVCPAEIDLLIVPGLAFDRQGGRIGFGKGYYDRFLSQLPAMTCACGLAFACQIVPCVPRLPHDICMQYIVTEQETISCAHTAACRPD
jgi:5-formyltetrahydrofolate cyclo-ligase